MKMEILEVKILLSSFKVRQNTSANKNMNYKLFCLDSFQHGVAFERFQALRIVEVKLGLFWNGLAKQGKVVFSKCLTGNQSEDNFHDRQIRLVFLLESWICYTPAVGHTFHVINPRWLFSGEGSPLRVTFLLIDYLFAIVFYQQVDFSSCTELPENLKYSCCVVADTFELYGVQNVAFSHHRSHHRPLFLNSESIVTDCGSGNANYFHNSC